MNQLGLRLEEQVIEKANFLYICKYNGKEHLRNCIREALHEITKLNEIQMCKMFDIFNKDIKTIQYDFEKYVDELYERMKEKGAE